MDSSTQQKRKAVADAYSGPSWTEKISNMSDAQVVAVYLRLKAQGKI